MFEIFMTKSTVLASVIGAISLILTAAGILTNPTPVVTTKNGYVQGRMAYSRNGNKYFEYLSIPYAEPPVGELRFEAPLPIQRPWEGVLQANRFPPKCLQFDSMVTGRLYGVENCLFVNVFTYDTNPDTKKTVLVYIHGGGFLSGASKMYGPKYLMDEDIVLVTLNYRLGPLGFLSLEDNLIRGNMGLKDQNLAMKWVQENIQQFGGDPSRITLFGESAGAASVHYHMVSPLSQGLFQRAILQSGAVTNLWAFAKNPREVAMRYINELKCPTSNMSELVSCLKAIDAEDLVKLQIHLMDPVSEFDMFVPSAEVVIEEDTFLAANPRDLLREGKFAKVPLMLGVTSGEGSLRTARFDAMPERIAYVEEHWCDIVPRILCNSCFDKNCQVSEKIRQFYFGSGSFKYTHDTWKNASMLNSDALFFEPIHRAAILHARQGPPTYLYYYDYNSVMLPSMYSIFRAVRSDDWILSELSLAWAIAVDWCKENIFGSEGPHDFGSTHADDLFQLWNMEGITDTFLVGSDIEFSQKLVKTTVSFAKNEEPLEFDGISWPPIELTPAEPDGSVTSSHRPLQYMLLSQQGKVIDEPFASRIDFWDSLKIREKD